MARPQGHTAPRRGPQARRAEPAEQRVNWAGLLGSIALSWAVVLILGYWAFG